MNAPETETYTHFCCGGCGSEFPIADGIDETGPMDPVPVYTCRDCADDTQPRMSSKQIIDLLDAKDVDNCTRDLGRSGGGDWWAIEVSAPRGCFVLITPAGYPYDANDSDDSEEFLTLNLYGAGEYEDDLGDRPWTTFDRQGDTAATPEAILAAIAAARKFAETWDFDLED